MNPLSAYALMLCSLHVGYCKLLLQSMKKFKPPQKHKTTKLKNKR